MKYLKYIGIGLGALIALAILISSLGRVKLPLLDVKTSFRRVDAEAKAKKLEKQLGAAQASHEIEKIYAKEIAALDKEEGAEFLKLKDDPVKLAKLLAGKKVRNG